MLLFDNRSGKNFIDTISYIGKIKKALRFVNKYGAAGSDNIPDMFYKNLCNCVFLSLSTIFQNSFSRGNLPEKWCLVNVCQIFKKDNANEVVNYRPVFPTCIACKIMGTTIK